MVSLSPDVPQNRASEINQVSLTLEERNALTHAYVIGRGFDVVGSNGALGRFIRALYPQAPFDLLAEAFRDAMKGDAGPSVIKIDQLTTRVGGRKQRMRHLASRLTNLK